VKQTYLDTARLLTQVAPFVFVDDTFALKCGTAINLFVRDMPRLSVDLDLVFPDALAVGGTPGHEGTFDTVRLPNHSGAVNF
jgi:hypothetical protein